MFRRSIYGIMLALVMVFETPSGALAQEGFRPLKTVHFNLQYQSGVGDGDARRVADYLESEYQYLSATLRLDLRQPVDVRIYGDESSFLVAAKQQKTSRGAFYTRGVMHVRPPQVLEQRQVLERSLSYELSLAMLDAPSAGGCPRWLRESFAVYHSAEMADLTMPSGVRVRYFSDLEEDLAQYPDPPRSDDVHYLLGKTMQYLIERFGQEKVFGMFRMFDGTHSVDEVFQAGLGQDFETVERAWGKYIQETMHR